MEFHEIVNRATEIRELYRRLESRRHGRPWTTEEIGLGFVGDVGDLAKLLQAQEGVRNIEDWKTKLAHELSDCLWSVIILAQESDIDLESEFLRTMDELHRQVSADLDNLASGIDDE